MSKQSPSWQDEYIQTNGVKLHYVTQGDGPLMLMLHGFPEFWYAWSPYIPKFAQDYKVVAIDLRGYNDSERPTSLSAYQIDVLIEDICGVIQTLGGGTSVLVAHDWGGGLAWSVANAYPDLVERLIILNMPHPAKLAAALKGPAQFFKSFYFFFFQLPKIPEWFLSRNHYDGIGQLFTSASPDGTFTAEDVNRYKEAAAKPGALTAMLSYYRNIFKPNGFLNQSWQTLTMPTLLIWGDRDTAFGKELTEDMDSYVQDLQIHYVSDGSHWLPQEKPQLVQQYIQEFLSKG